MRAHNEASGSSALRQHSVEQDKTFDLIMSSAVILSFLSLLAYFAFSHGIHSHIEWVWASLQKVLKHV